LNFHNEEDDDDDDDDDDDEVDEENDEDVGLEYLQKPVDELLVLYSVVLRGSSRNDLMCLVTNETLSLYSLTVGVGLELDYKYFACAIWETMQDMM